MEKQPANNLDERVSQMAKALREEEMPSPPANLMARHPGKSLQSRGRAVAGRELIAFGTAAALVATIVITSLPRESAAAELQKIAEVANDVLRHEFAYDRQPDGAWKLDRESWIQSGKFRYIPKGNVMETLVLADTRYNIDHTKGYVLKEAVQPREAKAFFYQASLKRQLGFEHVKSVKRDGTVQWKGRSLDKFVIHSEFLDGLGQPMTADSILYADTTTDRPYWQEVTLKGGTRGEFINGHTNAVEWQYPASAGDAFAINWPKSYPIYEPAKMREQVKDQVTATMATTTVAGIKVTLRAVYLNSFGSLNVFTTGGTGRIEKGPGLRVDGKEAETTMSAGQNHCSAKGGAYVFEPLNYRGLKLVYQASFLGRTLPDSFDLEVPVWKADGSRYGRSFVGYAKFENVVPTRFEGQVLSDMNRSVLWGPRDFEIEDASQ